MIAGDDSLEPREDRLDTSTTSRGSGGDVLGSQVLTDTGTDLGSVVDAIIEANGSPEGRCAVVSYEIRSSEALGHKGTTLLIPLPHTVVVSGEHLIVPANATDFVGNDLAGFGAAVAAFRAQLRGQV